MQEAVATKPQRITHVSRLNCYRANNDIIHRLLHIYNVNAYTTSNKIHFFHRKRKMLSYRSQVFISTICGLISIATAQLGAGCPEAYGVQTYPDEKYCDRFYKVSITFGCYFHILRNNRVSDFIYWYHTIKIFLLALFSAQTEHWLKKFVKMVSSMMGMEISIITVTIIG